MLKPGYEIVVERPVVVRSGNCGFSGGGLRHPDAGQLGNPVFVPVPDDRIHPGDRTDGVGLGFGVAPGDYHPGIRVRPDDLPNGLPSLHGGLTGDGTGVDDADVGRGVL